MVKRKCETLQEYRHQQSRTSVCVVLQQFVYTRCYSRPIMEDQKQVGVAYNGGTGIPVGVAYNGGTETGIPVGVAYNVPQNDQKHI